MVTSTTLPIFFHNNYFEYCKHFGGRGRIRTYFISIFHSRFNRPQLKPHQLHSQIILILLTRQESNLRPFRYERTTLPTELRVSNYLIMSRIRDSNPFPKFGRLPCNHQHLFCKTYVE